VDTRADLTPILDAVAQSQGRLRLYALADAAQNNRLPQAIRDGVSRCLFSYDDEAPVSKVAPHLVPLPLAQDSKTLLWITRYALASPCITLIASSADFETVFAHLVNFLEVRFEDGGEMFLAYWDPMILATLVGQADDDTLHVKGSVFTPEQQQAFLDPIEGWWYWSRAGRLHCIKRPEQAVQPENPVLPLSFTQAQTDQLVEASVPDHVLNHMRENQPGLLLDIPKEGQYGFVRKHVVEARNWGLAGMGDLVNYCSAAVIYGEALQQDPAIMSLLAEVKAGKRTFDEALDLFP
jgi:hypothetical protein